MSLTDLHTDLIKHQTGNMTMEAIRNRYRAGDYGTMKDYIAWAVKTASGTKEPTP